MSQEARMRVLIDDAVRQATEALEERLDALDARLRPLEDAGDSTHPAEGKRPSRGRPAKSRTDAADGDGGGSAARQ
jgi:hypothetical protein